MLQVHEKIRQARVSAGLSVEELAEKIGVKRTTYQYWEEVTPSLAKIRKVAKALGIPAETFIGVPMHEELNQTIQNLNDNLEKTTATTIVLVTMVTELEMKSTGLSLNEVQMKMEKAINDRLLARDQLHKKQ
jgi:transcriptional regulator with XRE-family HTH domain